MTDTQTDPTAPARAAYAARREAAQATIQAVLRQYFDLTLDPSAIDPNGWYVSGIRVGELSSAYVALPDATLRMERTSPFMLIGPVPWLLYVIRPCAACGQDVESAAVYDLAGLGMRLETFYPATCLACPSVAPVSLRAELTALRDRITTVLEQLPTE